MPTPAQFDNAHLHFHVRYNDFPTGNVGGRSIYYTSNGNKLAQYMPAASVNFASNEEDYLTTLGFRAVSRHPGAVATLGADPDAGADLKYGPILNVADWYHYGDVEYLLPGDWAIPVGASTFSGGNFQSFRSQEEVQGTTLDTGTFELHRFSYGA